MSTTALNSEFRSQVDAYKAILRSCLLFCGDRRSGCTQAIIEVIHEDHAGEALYAADTWPAAENFMRRYQAAYPDDRRPEAMAINRCTTINKLRGRDLRGKVYVDGWQLVEPDLQDEFRAALGSNVVGAA